LNNKNAKAVILTASSTENLSEETTGTTHSPRCTGTCPAASRTTTSEGSGSFQTTTTNTTTTNATTTNTTIINTTTTNTTAMTTSSDETAHDGDGAAEEGSIVWWY